jgi:CRISPR-associated protein Csm5
MTEVRSFRMTPLTPVHIGSGDRLAPEEYVVDGQEFVRLDSRAILRALSAQERTAYEAAVDAGRLRDAQRVIRRFWQASRAQGSLRFERFRAAIGESSREDLRQIIEQPERRGDVLALQRNPYTGAVVIPGSSIKGVMRTALASWLANTEPGPRRIATAQQTAQRGWDGRRLEQAVFGYNAGETEGDPLRLLHVADAEWPAGGVQVDKPELTKLGRGDDGTERIQMHVERLLSRGDGTRTPAVTVALRLETPGRRSRLFARAFAWEEIVFACNRFYANRLNAEYERFSQVAHDGYRWKPTQQEFERGLLLRLGRFSHFDSMSVDRYREGRNAARKEPIREIGSTRTMCPLRAGGRAPFGWVLLEPQR